MSNTLKKDEQLPADCWSRIGILGDGSCPRLAAVIHCRNCPVYIEGGRGLLDRAPPPDYLQEWTRLLAEPKETIPADAISIMVFRVGAEWLALNTMLFQRVAPVRAVHRIPHRSGRILRGLVNIDGELLLCADLSGLLGLEEQKTPASNSDEISPWMMVAARRNERWAFQVDEVVGIQSVSLSLIEKPPVTVARAAVSYAKGLFEVQGRVVALLDENSLFEGLKKSLKP